MSQYIPIAFNGLYSQSGQDAVILASMPDNHRGTFVEVGCIDGRRFSNTLALERRGWTGLCIEAHPAYIDRLRANRPGSRVIHAAVGEHDAESVTLHANSRGTLSTLDPTLEDNFAEKFGEYFTGFVPTLVPMRSLATILDEANLPHPDVLTIDTEGCDAAVVRGLDVQRHRPRLIIVEAYRPGDLDEIDSVLLPEGYQRCAASVDDHFYFRDEADLDRIAGIRLETELTWTTHPLDEGADEVKRASITITRAA